MSKSISVVIPILNEEGSIDELYSKLTHFFKHYDAQYELIFVNDGSTDDSESILQKLAFSDPRVVILTFRRMFGQTAAFSAGFREATGNTVITLDGDLQYNPEDIARLIEKYDQGFDLVTGWRKDRKDQLWSRKLPSLIANKIIAGTTGVKIHDYGCSLRAYRASILKEVKLYGEMHRFIPALLATVGARIGEVEVSHYPRIEGTSKYTISRTFRVILDLLTVTMQLRFATRPLHFLGIPGLFSIVSGFAICSYLTYIKLFKFEDIADRPLLILGVLLIIVGFQFFSIGLLAELIVRLYHESTDRLPFHIRSKISNRHKIEY